MNQQYQETWEMINKLKKDKLETMEAANIEYKDICKREEKNRSPKSKKKEVELPKELIKDIRDDVLSIYQPKIDKINSEIAENLTKLKSLENTVKFEPCENAFYMLDSSWSSTYSSVGDSNAYAKAAITPCYSLLKDYGFSPQIREVHNYVARFELWADCEPYMFDVLKNNLTEEHMLSAGVNPLVLWPFARDLYDKWLKSPFGRNEIKTIIVRNSE